MARTWIVGCRLLLLLIIIAFTGYVLPWGQISFWGATVITNLFSAVPYVGTVLVEWLWGGFSVGDATLKRFFVFHFLGPFILLVLVGIHIIFLHDTGSRNPLGIERDAEALPFHRYYLLKDLVGIFIIIGCLFLICFCFPDLFLDPVNFIPADPIRTPLHIQPEWYFLFAYSILRRIPNKLGGVIALFRSVVILYFMPFYPKRLIRGVQFNPIGQVVFWIFVRRFIILTFIGSCPIEPPFVRIGLISGVIYFCFYIFYPLACLWWDQVIDRSINRGLS